LLPKLAPPIIPAPAPAGGRVEGVLLAVVAEKTGYPPEMLELDMALDADLGIDSIKRVEFLSALQEQLPQAPVVKPEHLGTLHTLRQIAAFLAGEGRPAAPALPEPAGGIVPDRSARTEAPSSPEGLECVRKGVIAPSPLPLSPEGRGEMPLRPSPPGGEGEKPLRPSPPGGE